MFSTAMYENFSCSFSLQPLVILNTLHFHIMSGMDFFCFCFALPCDLWDLSSPGIEPRPPAMETWNPNHFTAREFLCKCYGFLKFHSP